MLDKDIAHFCVDPDQLTSEQPAIIRIQTVFRFACKYILINTKHLQDNWMKMESSIQEFIMSTK